MPAKRIEKSIEHFLFASRWLMTPFYVGLVGALLILLTKFIEELVHIVPNLLSMTEADAILAVLTLIDLSLAGNLVIMVIFSGYESFVSKIEVGANAERPAWMGKVDFAGLKLKLVASIVAISGIHLLKVFMNLGKHTDREVQWVIIIHVVFVISGVLLALMDKLTASAHHDEHEIEVDDGAHKK